MFVSLFQDVLHPRNSTAVPPQNIITSLMFLSRLSIFFHVTDALACILLLFMSLMSWALHSACPCVTGNRGTTFCHFMSLMSLAMHSVSLVSLISLVLHSVFLHGVAFCFSSCRWHPRSRYLSFFILSSASLKPSFSSFMKVPVKLEVRWRDCLASCCARCIMSESRSFSMPSSPETDYHTLVIYTKT